MKTPYKAILPTVATTVSEKPTQGVEQIARGLDRKALAHILRDGDSHDLKIIRDAIKQIHKGKLETIEINIAHFGQPVTLDRAYLTVLYEALTKQLLCHRFGEIRSIAELKKMDPVYAEIMSDAKVLSEFAKKLDAIRDQWDKLAIGYDRWADIVTVRNLIAQLEDEELGLQLRAQKGSLSASQLLRLDEIQLQIVSLRHQLSGSDDHGNRVGLEVESREVATVVRVEQLLEWFRQIKENNFAEFASRKEIMDEIRSAMLSGKSTLITGATGTGKTVLAVQVAKQIQRKMVELSGDNIIDAKLLSDELIKNPDYVAVLSGNANMTVGEIIAKIGIKAIDDGKGRKIMETNTQLGKILKAYNEGRIPIFDEIDLVPNDILMRTKHLATLKPGDIYTPQENGGSEVWIRNNIQLATANLKGSHHPDREDLDPAIVRLYQGITAGYLSKDEAYDRALLSCMSPNGSMIGISPAEWKKDGFVMRIVEFMKQIEDNYMGLTPLGAGIDSNDQYLSKAVMDIGIFSGLFAGYQTNRRAGTKIRNFREYVTDNLIKFITNQGYPLSDRMMLIQMANAKGLIDTSHKEIILKKCPDLSVTTFTVLLTNAHSDLSKYDTHTVAVLTPYELAQLDPYDVRKIDQLEWSQYAQITELSRVLSTLEGHFLTGADHPVAQQVNALLTQIVTKKGINDPEIDALILDMEEAKGDDNELQKLFDKITTTTLGQASVWRVQATIERRIKKRAEEADRLRKQKEINKQGFNASAEIFDVLTAQKPQSKLSSAPGVSSRPALTSGPEYDRIQEYQKNFALQINKSSENTKTIPELIALAQEIQKKGFFRLATNASGLSVGEWKLGGKARAITNAGSLFDENDETVDPGSIKKYDSYNQTLREGSAFEPTWASVSNKDTTQRPPTIQTKTKPLIDQGLVPMHHTGDDEEHNVFRDVVKALENECGISDDDAIVIMMYLQGLYGQYFIGGIGGNRGFVFCVDDLRRFSSNDYGDGSASLLFAEIDSPEGFRDSGPPPSEEAVAEHGRMQEWWKQNITNMPLQFLDETTGDSITLSDNDAARAELDRRCEAFAAEYVSLQAGPLGNGWTTRIEHPDLDNPKNFHVGQFIDFKNATGVSDDGSLSHKVGKYAEEQKLYFYLRSIRGNINDPDSLDDEVWENDDKTGKKEKNHTKTYLQAMHAAQPGIKLDDTSQQQEFLQFLATQLKLPNTNEKLLLLARQRIVLFAGGYWNGQYENNSRGIVNCYDVSRSFGSYSFVNFDASLLFSRDG